MSSVKRKNLRRSREILSPIPPDQGCLPRTLDVRPCKLTFCIDDSRSSRR